jgi:hypothetical protein
MEPIAPSRLESSAAALGDAIPIAEPFADALLQLHHAVQIAAEVGKSWAAPQPDDSHSNFEWRDGFLLGAVVAAPRPFRAALRPHDLALRLVAEDGAVLAARALAGATATEALNWVRAQAALFAGTGERQPSVPAPDLPAHPVAEGAAFAVRDRDAWAALARLLAGADSVLRAVQASTPDAAAVRLWPHHFDIATLIAPEPGRSIGVGLAVPDTIDASGYWYVSPWAAEKMPAAAAAGWPSLANGRFVPRGESLPIAAFPLDAFAQIETPQARIAALAVFLSDAIASSAAKLGI